MAEGNPEGAVGILDRHATGNQYVGGLKRRGGASRSRRHADACLVKQNKDNSRNYDMVRTLTKMFHDMDLEIIAEGAETAAEVNDLAEKGVDRVQGFALARPMPVDALLEFYRKQPSAQ